MVRALATGDAELAVAPGNPGTGAIATNLPELNQVDDIVRTARGEHFDLVVVGPEAPLVAGLGNALRDAGIPCCGPDAEAAWLEGSKLFTRELGAEIGLPQPRFVGVREAGTIDAALSELPGIPVVKADGLAGGKGVSLPDDLDGVRRDTEILLDAGGVVVLEERLSGTEASLFYACCGEDAVELPNARDHKRLLDGQQGPNTGGMGAISPNPELDEASRTRVRADIVEPTLRKLVERNTPFRGFLYVGVMLTADGPQLVEFNVRLGDPEAQCVLPRIADGQFLELCRRVARDELAGFSLDIDPRPTVAVVVTADGYPRSARSGDVIEISPDIEGPNRWIDQAGTGEQTGRLVTKGGRVAALVSRGQTPQEARAHAYQGVAGIRFNGMHYRNDIGG